jgi:hypothetical protein
MKNFFVLPCVLALVCLFLACPSEADNGNSNNGNNNNNNNNPGVDIKTGKVTFFNESSYGIIVHQDAFSGPVLAELGAGQTKKVDVRTSDNYGVGSTFSIEYLYRITDAFDAESGEVIASGIDPNIQINFVVEENKTYTKQIPQPQNLEFQAAFIKILNSGSLQFELHYLSSALKQTGNGNLSVASGKTGVYKLEGIPSEGKNIENYTCVSTFQETVIPDFTAQNGFIYTFTYNGSSVTQTGSQSIVFK